MKSYPEIFKFPCKFKAEVFDKLDGSNLRFEWSKKRGWYKYGTRNRMFDETDLQFSDAIPLFHNTLADKVAEIASNQKWEKVVVFAEYWGKQSVAGYHSPEDEKYLTLFDASPHKKGMLPPKEFRKLFEDKVNTPRYLGQHNWTKGFLTLIRSGEFPGITFEGVIGKGMLNGKLIMAKAKTQTWIDTVRKIHKDKAESLINS